MLLSILAEEKLCLRRSQTALLLGPVETPQDSLPKQVLGSSQGTLGPAELVEHDVCLWHWQQEPWQAKLSCTKPQPKTHFAHYLATAVLAASVGFSFRHHMA